MVASGGKKASSKKAGGGKKSSEKGRRGNGAANGLKKSSKKVPVEEKVTDVENSVCRIVSFRVTAHLDIEESPSTPFVFRYQFLNGERIINGVFERDEARATMTFVHVHEVEANDEFIERIDADPIVCFFVGCIEGEENDQASATIENQEIIESRPPPQSYLCAIHCDLSALLSNEMLVTASNSSLKVSVEVVDLPLMSEVALRRYNPLSIQILKLRRLPEACDSRRPLYCVLRSPLEKLGGNLARSSATSSSINTTTHQLSHTVVYLTGKSDNCRLYEALSRQPLTMEVHDRDNRLPQEPIEDQSQLDTLCSAPDLALTLWSQMATGENTALFETAAHTFGLTLNRSSEEVEKGCDSKPSLKELDLLYSKALKASWARAGDKNAHGVAETRLDKLFEPCNPFVNKMPVSTEQKQIDKCAIDANDEVKAVAEIENEALSTSKKNTAEPPREAHTGEENTPTTLPKKKVYDPRVAIKEKVRVVGRKRRLVAGGEEILNTVQIGAYTEAETEISLRCTLFEPIDKKVGLFTRAVFHFPYSDSDIIKRICTTMDAINSRSLMTEASLKSFQLNQSQVAAADTGDLELLAGFHIIDRSSRLVLIEGSIEAIAEVCKSVGPRSIFVNTGYKLLADPSVRFTKRMYTEFNTDLKKIRLRRSLPELATCPEIYNRARVSEQCFAAIHGLATMMLRAHTLQEIAVLDSGAFPEVEMLLQIESKFGEAVSLIDITGDPALVPESDNDKSLIVQHVDKRCTTEAPTTPKKEVGAAAIRLKAATETSNPVYEAALRNREVVDYLEARRLEAKRVAESYETRKQEVTMIQEQETIPTTFVYSGQKLQYTELKKAEERTALSKQKNAVFIRASSADADYLSLAVPLVDETRLREDAAFESKKRWMTKRGFVYPPPKSPKDYKRHPNEPSQSRKDELAQPWQEPQSDGTTEGLRSSNDRSKDINPQSPFDTIPIKRPGFGGLEKLKYERSYDGALFAQRKLPRGRATIDKMDDVAYLRSVHLCGEGLEQEAKEAKDKERADFNSKLIVDTLDVKVSRFVQKDQPNQTDRLQDILHDPPNTLALKKQGAREPLPYSIFASGEYVSPSAYAQSLRQSFHGADQSNPDTDKKDWTKYFHGETLRRTTERLLYRRDILPIDQVETTGDLRWGHSVPTLP